MAPRKKRPASDDEPSDSEYSEHSELPSESESESDFEEEEEATPPPKKKAPAKRPPAKKQTPAAKAEPKDEAGGSGVKSTPKKVKPPTKLTTLPGGWHLQPPHFIYKLDVDAQGGENVAAFDLDGTLVAYKSGRSFPTGPDDWKWFNKEVPDKLKQLHDDGYQLVIFTNQGGIKGALNGKASENFRGRIDNVLAALERKFKQPLPVQIFCATADRAKDDPHRKPRTAMWEFFAQQANGGVAPNLPTSFFCGDAAGRAEDINSGASSDLDFAKAVGLPFRLPEDVFGAGESKKALPTGESTGLNSAMAQAFRTLADLLAGDHFKSAAFNKVAGIIDAFPDVITSAKQLAGVAGVGKSSQAKITEFLETGTLAALEEAGLGGGAAVPVGKEAEVALKFM